MKIQKVKINKFKALENIEEQIDGRNIMLVGDNAVGKSSFIQFIEIALGSQNIPPNALGDGEVITDKNGNEYRLKVKIKDGKSTVEITGPDGLKDNRKGTLATLVGAIEFDIDEFVELSKSTAGRKKQIEIFKSFLDNDTKETLARYEVDNKLKFDERTELNRNIKSAEVEINAHPLRNIMDLSTFKPVDTTAVYDQLKVANEKNTKISEVESRLAQREREIEKDSAEIEDLKKRIASLTMLIDEKKDANTAASNWLKENAKVDITAFETQIQGANEANQKHEQAKSLASKREHFAKMQEEAGSLTVLIESGRQAIADAIRDMKGPVDGLSFDDEQLVYNGIPVNPDSLSTSEIMELGIRLKMAENPDLGILFIQRGESLGAKRLKEIQEIAKNAGWQLIMEQVERGKEKLCIELMEG